MHSTARRRHRGATVSAVVAALLLGAAPPAAAAPATPAGLPSAIEPHASYVPQSACDATVKPGAAALRSLVMAAYAGSGDSGIVRDCAVGGTSEHKEGRAWDWRVNAADPVQDAWARDLLTWLLATDRHGNSHAMARRLGVMYVIYNRSIWSAYNADAGWRPYTGSNPHTDHVHISLSWPGASKSTSFWTGAVAPAVAPTPAPSSTASPTATTAIAAAWERLGGAAGVLGAPVGQQYAVRGGRAQDYERGAVYWSSATGAHAVHGAVRGRYAAAGGADGPLGLPTTDETGVRGGRVQGFSGGRVYWSATSGARLLWGAVLTAYLGTGGPDGPLGLPTREETGVRGGVVAEFQGGTVHWSATTGAHPLTGAVAARHRALGGADGLLGLPTSGATAVRGGSAVSFTGGRVYTSAAGTFAVWGGIADKHRALGGPDSPLGLPVGEETAVPGGVQVAFAGGRVYWSASTGARGVWGGIGERYAATGGPAGPLGLPTSDEVDVPGGRMSAFQGGRVVWSAATGARAVWGGVGEAYVATGGPAGPLGLPVGEETDVPGVPGARTAAFQLGRVYWSPATGARAVWGAIAERYLALGGPAVVGLPVTGEQHAGAGVVTRFQRGSVFWSAGTGARYVYGGILDRYLTADLGAVGLPTGEEGSVGAARVLPLQRGAVVWTPATGARLVAGPVADHWRQHGGPNGFLGAPVREQETAAPGVQRQVFAGGEVYTSTAGTHHVRGGILLRYLALGGAAGALGAPASVEYDVPGGRRSDFAGGSLVWTAATGAITRA